VVLREPVSRASSHYLMDTRVGIQELPFYEAIKEDYGKPEKGWYISHLYVELGLYCEQISRYLDRFDRERLLIMFFEDVISDTDAALTSIASFLEVDADVAYGSQTFEKQNPHATPRIGILRPALDNEGIRRLGQRLLPGDLRRFLRDRVLTRNVEKPQIDYAAIELLRRLYDSQQACLQRLLGRGLPWD
jgi:hypothetical protein